MRVKKTVIDKEKIIIMAKLAVYDKNMGKEDRKDDVYFRQDYIYAGNMRTRFYVFLGCIILTVFYFLHRMAFDDINILNYIANYFTTELIRIVIFFTAVLVFYTFVGTILYTALYAQTQKRIENYFKLLDELEGVSVKTKEDEERREKMNGEDDEDEDDDDDEDNDDEDDDEDNEGYGEYEYYKRGI